MKNEVLQTVLDYIESPQTDYALLITGPWGCGKTYFWKHLIEPEIKNIKNSGHKRVLYISLYGISDVKEIDRSLFVQSYPGISRKSIGRISRLAGSVIEALGFADLAKVDLRSLVKAHEAVVCFDDLERSKLTMKELLGYINTFVEHEGAKVIILCNEAGIAEEEILTYKTTKEKVVGASLSFRPDIDTVFGTLINECKAEKGFQDFLIKNTELMKQLFFCSATNNLRSVRRAIAALFTIFQALLDGHVDPNKIGDQLIYAVLPTAFELYGLGADPEKLRSIHSRDYISLAGILLFAGKADKSSKKEYEQEFNDRYFDSFDFLNLGRAVGCPPVCEFMITGFLDRSALLEWAKHLIEPPDEKTERIKQLMNSRDMEDDEFGKTSLQVLQEVENGEITTISTYATLYGVFESFAEARLVSEIPDQILQKFKTGLEKAKQSGKLEPKAHFKFELNLLLEPKAKECQAFCKYILEVNDSIIQGSKRNRINELIASFHDDPQVFINALAGSEFILTPVFQQLDPDTAAKQIQSLPNKLKSRLRAILQERYLNCAPQPEFVEEVAVLTRIRDMLKKHCEAEEKGSHSKKMSLFLTQGIIKTLEQIVDKLQNSKNGETAGTQ